MIIGNYCHTKFGGKPPCVDEQGRIGLSPEEIGKLRFLIYAVKLKLAVGEWSVNEERIDFSTVALLEKILSSVTE